MTPVYIERCYGVLHPADGSRGVVICGSLGDEYVNTYRAQVFLAESLAEAGIPALRISYYGTGDSAGADDEPGRFGAWIDSIAAAARWLRNTCGVTSVVLCGLRIGAALAARAAIELGDVEALVLLAPVATGRRFLREQTLTARTVADIWQSVATIDDGRWFEAYGLRLDGPTRDALSTLDVGQIPRLSVQRALVLDLPGPAANNRLVAHLRAQGIAVTHGVGKDCDRLLSDSHESTVPRDTFKQIAKWIGAGPPVGRASVSPVAASLELQSSREVPVTLGPGDSLVGILSLPRRQESSAPVVLIPSTGANPRFGTSRGAAVVARWLAEQGVSSLRMDGHGIGDAAPATGDCGRPYSQQGDADVRAGVEFLAARFEGPIIVFGMCSGAYHALQAALVDKRINGLMLVNLQKFVWHDGESLSVVQRTTLRTTAFYLRNIANRAMWLRLMRGQINVLRISGVLAGRAVRQIAAAADPAIAVISGETQVGMVRRQLSELSRRPVPILYILSGNDPGLDEIEEYFGFRGWRLRRTPGLTFHRMDGADHTLSADWARRSLRKAIAGFLRQRFAVDVVAEVDEPKRPERQVPRGSSRPGTSLDKASIVIDSAPTAA